MRLREEPKEVFMGDAKSIAECLERINPKLKVSDLGNGKYEALNKDTGRVQPFSITIVDG